MNRLSDDVNVVEDSKFIPDAWYGNRESSFQMIGTATEKVHSRCLVRQQRKFTPDAWYGNRESSFQMLGTATEKVHSR